MFSGITDGFDKPGAGTVVAQRQEFLWALGAAQCFIN
jgi:hypothetical protein